MNTAAIWIDLAAYAGRAGSVKTNIDLFLVSAGLVGGGRAADAYRLEMQATVVKENAEVGLKRTGFVRFYLERHVPGAVRRDGLGLVDAVRRPLRPKLPAGHAESCRRRPRASPSARMHAAERRMEMIEQRHDIRFFVPTLRLLPHCPA